MSIDPTGASPFAGSRRELRALTGLRGLCASIVVIAHYDLRDISWAFGATLWHNAAVDVFFVLSGFTMFYVHGRERERLDFRNFMAKRVARLWPLCLLTLLLAIPPYWKHASKDPIASGMTAADVVRQILMVNGWPLVGSGLHYDVPQWSVSVEFLLYLLLFPVLYVCSGHLKRLRPLTIAAAT